MAIYTVLPDGDLGSCKTGRRIRHPVIGMNEVSSGNTVVLLPASAAASILAVAPPIGITSPRTFSEPVKATVWSSCG